MLANFRKRCHRERVKPSLDIAHCLPVDAKKLCQALLSQIFGKACRSYVATNNAQYLTFGHSELSAIKKAVDIEYTPS